MKKMLFPYNALCDLMLNILSSIKFMHLITEKISTWKIVTKEFDLHFHNI